MTNPPILNGICVDTIQGGGYVFVVILIIFFILGYIYRSFQAGLEMKITKCDLCGNEVPRNKLVTFNKNQLKKSIVIPVGLSLNRKVKKTKVGDKWLHKKFKKLEETNPDFKRKSRVCQDCLKEVLLG